MRVIADMLGFPPEDGAAVRELRRERARGRQPARSRSGWSGPPALFDYLFAQVRDHVANPRDDLTTYLLNAELDGQKLEPLHVAGTMALLLIAGIDTTWSAIGASLWHLAKHPEDRRAAGRRARAAADGDGGAPPGLRPGHHGPAGQGGHGAGSGVDMKADDWVLLPFPAANRDPERFERADEVVIDREVNRHAAFGLGIHRCVGLAPGPHGAAGRARGLAGAASRSSPSPTRPR